ncbi:MAG: sensor histidine kinase [Oscillospiraceae bacterium]
MTGKRHSLKWRMIILLLGCWVLPVVLLVFGVGVYVTKATEKETRETVQASAQSALDIMRGRLDAAVNSSLAASYNPTLRLAWLNYVKDNNYTEFAGIANNFLSQTYKFDEKFLSTFMVLKDEPEHRFNVNNNRPYITIMDYWKNVSEHIMRVSDELGTGIAFVTHKEHLYMVRNLLNTDYYNFAVLVMELDKESLLESMNSVTWGTNYTVWIGDDAVCFKNNEIQWDAAKKTENDVEYGDFDNQLSVYGNTAQDYYDLSYCVTIDPIMLQSQRKSVRAVLIGICIILVPLLAMVFHFFYRKVTKPIQRLTLAAGEIEKGRFGYQIDANKLASAEFSNLGDSFNDMSATLKNQFERIYSEELALRDAKIMALQSQINPHFLNNTLEIINWEARLAGDIKVCKMIEALSTMLSAAMDRRHRPLVHLSEELMYVDSYLYIIRERLGKRLTIEKEIAPEALDCDVPRLVLQPIIENAVEHGINFTSHGTIKIRAYINGDTLILEIENDGKCSAEDLAKIEMLLSDEKPPEGTGATSLGIRNVNQRLRILYGNDSGLLVKMTNEGNVVSQISIHIEQDAQ